MAACSSSSTALTRLHWGELKSLTVGQSRRIRGRLGETAKEYFEGTVTLTASGKWRVIYDRDLQGVKPKLGWQQLHTAK